jgi:hypothetical protein
MTPIYMKRPEDAADAFQYVWNNHDMVAFAALFQDECDIRESVRALCAGCVGNY